MSMIKEPPAFGNYLIKDYVHIELPDPIDWSLTSPGWLVLYFVLLVLTIFIVYRWIKRYIRNKYRREALKQLALVADSNEKMFHILRIVATKAYPQSDAPSLTDQNWIDFLNSKTKKIHFDSQISKIFLDRYKFDLSYSDSLKSAIAVWIKKHRVEL